MKCFCPACQRVREATLEYYPTEFEIGFDKITTIAGHLFCECGYELHDEDVWYQGMKAAKIAYEKLNK